MSANYLSPLEFQVQIKRLPNVEFTTQNVTLPGLQSTPQETENPYNRLMWKGEKTIYSPLDLTFIIDEKMANWREIHNWITGTTSPQDASQFARLKKSREGIVSDITITILNSKKNHNIQFIFRDCFPFSVSPLELDTRSSNVPYPVATVSFAYNYYEITDYKRE